MKNDAWLKYNDACKKLIIAFTKKYFPEKYYPEESLATVYFVCEHYSIDFVQECLKLDATFEDICSYQDYGLDCFYSNKEREITFENWVKHPEMRNTSEQQPFTTEEKLRQLLKRCIPALEGVTMHESLVEEIQKEIKHL
jgi:hypothetical protein